MSDTRSFLMLAVGALSLAASGSVLPLPDRVRVEGPGRSGELVRAGRTWTNDAVRVSMEATADGERLSLAAPSAAPEVVRLSWNVDWRPQAKAYCGVETNGWRAIRGGVWSNWFFLLDRGDRTEGWGVRVQPGAFVVWSVRPDAVEAVFDVRAAGEGVELGDRTLEVAELVRQIGEPGASAFSVARSFCRLMCPNPRLPKEPVIGYNDWYCAYGANTATNFLADAAYVVEMARGAGVRPYVVMDDGWQLHSPPAVEKMTGKFDSGFGPWDRSSESFGMDMRTFAAKIAALGAKPGLWYRPLCRFDGKGSFDPTLPETKARIAREVSRFRDWGFKLVKADFITYDFIDTGVLNWADPPDPTRRCPPSIRWRDRSRTTAEVMRDIYRTMREAAGDDVLLIGCNAVRHFAAGLFELQRTGSDTSGFDWAKTARCGVNAIGMRNILNGTFFAADPDCIGLARPGAIPWEKNRIWLELVARSKSPLFISWKRSLATPEIRAEFARAFRTACEPGAVGEPLDWQENDLPRQWRFADGERTFDWLP